MTSAVVLSQKPFSAEQVCALCQEEFLSSDERWTHEDGHAHDPFHRTCLITLLRRYPTCPYRCDFSAMDIKEMVFDPLTKLSQTTQHCIDATYATAFSIIAAAAGVVGSQCAAIWLNEKPIDAHTAMSVALLSAGGISLMTAHTARTAIQIALRTTTLESLRPLLKAALTVGAVTASTITAIGTCIDIAAMPSGTALVMSTAAGGLVGVTSNFICGSLPQSPSTIGITAVFHAMMMNIPRIRSLIE